MQYTLPVIIIKWITWAILAEALNKAHPYFKNQNPEPFYTGGEGGRESGGKGESPKHNRATKITATLIL